VSVVALALTAVTGANSCAAAADSEAPIVPDESEPVVFAFRHGDVHFDSVGTRGRATMVALVTTYDMGSQLLLRRVQEALRAHRPRVNAGAVVMEGPKYEVLLDTYAEAMDLSFPVVLADMATREGRGPFGSVDYLPVLVILDTDGRVVARHSGPVDLPTILSELDRASASGRGDP
jgi:hypothetical protein